MLKVSVIVDPVVLVLSFWGCRTEISTRISVILIKNFDNVLDPPMKLKNSILYQVFVPRTPRGSLELHIRNQ
jgi:hypothetical protein